MTTADPVQYNIISVLKLFLSQTDPTLLPVRHQDTCTSHGVSSEEPTSPFSGPVWSSREQRPLQAQPQDTGGEPEGDIATKALLVKDDKNELHQKPEAMHYASQLQSLEDRLLQCLEDRLTHPQSHRELMPFCMDNQGIRLQCLEDRLFQRLDDRLSRGISSALPQSCSSVSTPEADRQRSGSGQALTSVTLASGAGQEHLLLNRGRRTRRGNIQGVESTSRGFQPFLSLFPRKHRVVSLLHRRKALALACRLARVRAHFIYGDCISPAH